MRHRRRLLAGPHEDTGRNTPIRDANFYALPFASQMIVWAMRKRISAMCRNEPSGDDVLHVFHMANLGELYAALLAVVDILVAARVHERSPMHAVSCPCIASHEAYVLNALAYVQNGAREEAILALCEVMLPAGARLAMPQLVTIVDEIKAQDLHFVYVDSSTLAAGHAAMPAATGRHAPKQVH